MTITDRVRTPCYGCPSSESKSKLLALFSGSEEKKKTKKHCLRLSSEIFDINTMGLLSHSD